MSHPRHIEFKEIDLDQIAAATGRITVFVGLEGQLDQCARRVNRLCKGALKRFVESPTFEKMKPTQGHDLSFPAGMICDAIQVIKLSRRPKPDAARKAGGVIAKAAGSAELHILAGNLTQSAEVSLGLALRGYDFNVHKTKPSDAMGVATFMVTAPEEVAASAGPMAAVAEGVFFTRDLVNEPANILTTDDFAPALRQCKSWALRSKSSRKLIWRSSAWGLCSQSAKARAALPKW